jgi:hypothetical protein
MWGKMPPTSLAWHIPRMIPVKFHISDKKKSFELSWLSWFIQYKILCLIYTTRYPFILISKLYDTYFSAQYAHFHKHMSHQLWSRPKHMENQNNIQKVVEQKLIPKWPKVKAKNTAKDKIIKEQNIYKNLHVNNLILFIC